MNLCSKECKHWKLEHVLSLLNEAISEITLIFLLVAAAILTLDVVAEDKKYHLDMAVGMLVQFVTK